MRIRKPMGTVTCRSHPIQRGVSRLQARFTMERSKYICEICRHNRDFKIVARLVSSNTFMVSGTTSAVCDFVDVCSLYIDVAKSLAMIWYLLTSMMVLPVRTVYICSEPYASAILPHIGLRFAFCMESCECPTPSVQFPASAIIAHAYKSADRTAVTVSMFSCKDDAYAFFVRALRSSYVALLGGVILTNACPFITLMSSSASELAIRSSMTELVAKLIPL